MKRRLFSIAALVLCLAMVLSAWGCSSDKDGNDSEQGSSVDSAAADVDIKDLDYSAAAVLITKGGSYTIDKEINGTVVIHTKDTLTLKLDGAVINSDIGPAVYVVNCGALTLELTGENTVSDASEYSGSFVYAKGAIASEDDLSICGSGSLTVTGNKKHGIVCDDSLRFNSGSVTIKSAISDGVHANDLIEFNGGDLTVESAGSDAVECEAKIVVNSGNLVLNSVGDALKAAFKDESGDNLCDICINGGTVTVNTQEDGIQSDGTLTVHNGVINITTTGEIASSGNNDRWDIGGMNPGMGGMNPGMGGGRHDKPGTANGALSDGNSAALSTAAPDDMSMPEGMTPPDGMSLPDDVSMPEGMTPPDGLSLPDDMSMPEDMTPPDDISVPNGNSTTDSDTEAADSSKGIKADGLLTINGGTITIDSTDDAIHSNGDVTVNGGELTLASGDDGIHADEALTINGGKINITKSYEGLEGKTVTINNGDISVIATDDGVNAASGNGSANIPGNPNSENMITISGGKLYVSVTSGDGIDSNGAFLIEGGIMSIYAGRSNGNSPLDADGRRTVNGGVLVAAGTSDMLENPQATSAQCTLVFTGLNLTEGETVALEDADGKVLMCYVLDGKASSLTISLPELSVGSTYSLYTGVTPSDTEACTDLYYGDDITAEGGTLLKEAVLSSQTTQAR